MTGLSEARAALERGGRVVLVTPPAPAQAGAVWELIPPRTPGLPPEARPSAPAAVLLCADAGVALDWAAAAPAGHSVYPATALGRTARLLKEGAVDILAVSLADLAALVQRSALKLETIGALVLAWPEAYATDPLLDALLPEAPAAKRIILSWNPPALRDFLERVAFRAPVIGAVPLDDTARALPPVVAARYVLTGTESRALALRAALDALDPRRPVVWRPGEPAAGPAGDLVICADVPARAELAALAARGPVLLLLTASQLPYARAIAAPLTAAPASAAADRSAERGAALRGRVSARLGAGDVDAELLVLAPLFAHHDPAEVAAALLALGREARSEQVGPAAPSQGFVKLFVNVGKKDRAGAKDLVGALIHEAGLTKTDIGRIELRDTFATVEVAASVVDTAMRKLTGTTIRGRRVQARRDRDA